MRYRPSFAWSVIFVSVAGAAIFEVASRQNANPLEIGRLAPEIALPSLESPGDTIRLSDYRGRVVLLEMWNTVCANCRDAMPVAESLAKVYGPAGFVVIHVANEDLGDTVRMRTFLRENGLSERVAVDAHRSFLSDYQIWAVPWSVLVDRAGKVAWQYPGVVAGARHPILTEDGQEALRVALHN
jgi:thiol-disulfide isomerase/thioredoxin